MQWRRVSATLVALVVVASCRADAGDDGPELGLDDGADVEVEADDDASSAEDDADGSSAEDDPLYPPLPPLEPDPTSDIPVDRQRLALALHEAVYEATQEALASPSTDLSDLQEVLADPLLGELVSGIEQRRSDGVVSRSPDTTIEWVRVVTAEGGPIVVQECRFVGERTGTYDIDSREPVELTTERVGVVFETTFELLEIPDGEVEYRAVELISGHDDERCHA